MLAELRSSMCKIRTLFQQSSLAQRQSEGEHGTQRKWLLSQDYCATVSRKLQQRRPLKGWTEGASKLRHIPRTAAAVTTAASTVQSTNPPNTTTLQVSSEPSSGTSVFKDDVFSSLELSDSPTTPFGIKAFKETRSQPLAVHSSEGPPDQYVMESLSEMDDDKETRNLIAQVNAGLALAPPKLCSVGTGGVYFMKSASCGTVAVFKPNDEEPKGSNNPKGYGQQQQTEGGTEDSLRAGIRTGEGAVRECAAFLLDHQSISGIPPTTMVSMTSRVDCDLEKVGSLQKYIPFDFDAEECGTGLFSVEEVQKICLADLRFVNTDRNGQNILVTKTKDGQTTLTPIDHGYCFPDTFSDIYFEWMHWPQAKKPFSSTFLEYIEELDPESDLEKLRNHNISFRPECNQIFLFCNYLLKWAVRRRCTPRDIAFILSDTSSKTLDNCFNCAKELSHGTMSESTVYEALSCHAGALMMLVDC